MIFPSVHTCTFEVLNMALSPTQQAPPAPASLPAQSITPELRRWIIEQARRIFSAPVVLQSMRDAGWDEDVAADAMETTLRDALNELAVQRANPVRVPVPEPLLGDSPALLNAGDRQVTGADRSSPNPRGGVWQLLSPRNAMP